MSPLLAQNPQPTNCGDPRHPASVGPCVNCLNDFSRRAKSSQMPFAERADELEAIMRPSLIYGQQFGKLGQGPRLTVRLMELLDRIDVTGVNFRDARGRPIASLVVDNLDSILLAMRRPAATMSVRRRPETRPVV